MLYDDQSVQKRSYLFWFLFFSLFLHAVLFLIFLLFGFESSSLNRLRDLFVRYEEPTIIVFHDDKPKQELLPEELQCVQKESQESHYEKEDRPPLQPPIIQVTSAKLTAPISSFGYPDAEKEATFDSEIPDSSDGIIEKVESAPVVQPEQEQIFVQRADTMIEQQSHQKDEPAIQKVAEHQEVQTLALVDQQLTFVGKDEEAAPSDNVSDQFQQKEPESKLAERIRSIEKKLLSKASSQQEIVSMAQNEEMLGFCVDGPEVKIRGAQAEEKKPAQKKNILALTKGFVEKLWGEDGTDLVDRDGDPNQRPSFEELKFIGYEAKINWALQASWKQNFEHNPRKRTAPGVVNVSFIIDAQGIPQNITIVQSSGHLDLDQTIISNIKSAAPFPPIPAHLQMAEYPVRRSIQVFLYGRSF